MRIKHKATGPERSTKAIGRRLQVIRELYGLNQTEFGAKLTPPMTQGSVSALESGARRPGLNTALQLCDAFDLTLDYIYRGKTGSLPGDLEKKVIEALKRCG